MLMCPPVGMRVVLHYNKRLVAHGIVPPHGKVGTVVVRNTRGKPRSHGVLLDDGTLVVVPGGNLNDANKPSKKAK